MTPDAVWGLIAGSCSVSIALAPFSHALGGRSTARKGGKRVSFPPLCCMLLAGTLWLIYGIYASSGVPLAASNFVVAVIGAYHAVSFLEQSELPREERRAALRLFGCTCAFVTGVAVYASASTAESAYSVRFLGLLATAASVALYGAPILDAVKMLRKRSAGHMSVPLTLAIGAAAGAWTAYGICVADFWVIGTNAIGVVFAAVQVAAIVYARYNYGERPDSAYSDRDGYSTASTDLLSASEDGYIDAEKDAENSYVSFTEMSPLLPPGCSLMFDEGVGFGTGIPPRERPRKAENFNPVRRPKAPKVPSGTKQERGRSRTTQKAAAREFFLVPERPEGAAFGSEKRAEAQESESSGILPASGDSSGVDGGLEAAAGKPGLPQGTLKQKDALPVAPQRAPMGGPWAEMVDRPPEVE